MKLSKFGKKYTAKTGILELIDDLGKAAVNTGEQYMLGGGNPAILREMSEVWKRRMSELAANMDGFEAGLARYHSHLGRPAFVDALADLLRETFGWQVTGRNIAVTNGSQTAFYMLFNLLAGEPGETRETGDGGSTRNGKGTWEGGRRRVLFPIIPEYIGYADQTLSHDDFTGVRPVIDQTAPHRHKYRIDFDALELTEDIAAICVSRPTNPTGNVLTNDEIARLDGIARAHDVPLLIDGAYGLPFPNIVFTDAVPTWNDNIVLGLSLSKLGLPSARTGIIVASEEIIGALGSANAIMSLATGTFGQLMAEPLIKSGELLSLSNEVIKPFYLEKSRLTLEWIDQLFSDSVEYSVHESEGAFFLWLWFKNLPITTYELYRRLKERNVIVVPGTYFFFGMNEAWSHSDECIRLNYAMPDEEVRRGLEIIAEEAKKAVTEGATRAGR
ncbi:MAG: valine--pyruvate transaminase [Spirochaetes bacterium]|jgi:valine--pyruvate aminotransferase|nr:valine--pyruvate transaminase [Spirochaetota bacterium]